MLEKSDSLETLKLDQDKSKTLILNGNESEPFTSLPRKTVKDFRDLSEEQKELKETFLEEDLAKNPFLMRLFGPIKSGSLHENVVALVSITIGCG